ncbi:MAG: hypothetical protein ABJ084_06030 [Halioglobus sp.]
MTLLIAGVLSACGSQQVTVKGDFPAPLMEPMPLRIGIWYDEAFSTHEFFDDAAGRSEASWLVKTGEAQVQMWDTVLGSMFVELIPMRGKPGGGEMNEVVDAILVPHIDELQYAIPLHTNVKVYEIWLRYRFDLMRNNGDEIASWTMTSYGKTPTAFLRSDTDAVNLAAVMALRDAGANFITNFARVPDVSNWLEQRFQSSNTAQLSQPNAQANQDQAQTQRDNSAEVTVEAQEPSPALADDAPMEEGS